MLRTHQIKVVIQMGIHALQMMVLTTLNHVEIPVIINDKLQEHHVVLVRWIFICLSIAALLFFTLLIVLGHHDFNDLSLPWLNPVLGPFGFLRGGHWARAAWKESIAFIVCLIGLIGLRPGNVYFRYVLFFFICFCWCCIGFVSYLVYGGDR